MTDIRRTKCYRIVMSKGDDIQIDAEELDKVVEGMNQGAIVVVKRGIANPSYISSIIPDKERQQEWVRECQYADGSGDRARERGLIPLKSMFDGTGTKVEKLVNEAMVRQIAIHTPTSRLEGGNKGQ